MRALLVIAGAMVLVVAAYVPAGADTIFLKSGGRLEGTVVEQTDSAVKLHIESPSGRSVLTIMRARVERIDNAPTFADRLARADSLLKVGEVNLAADSYRGLMREEPASAPARIGLARALVAAFKYAEAIATLENYAAVAPENPDSALLMHLAEQYLYARNFRDARKTARDAAAAKPDDKDLQAAASDFARRVDRVRSGSEQLQERAAAEQAERRKLKEERASWNKEQGNNKEAEQAGKMLEDWTVASQPSMLHARYVEITVPNDALAAYLIGGPERELQERATKCEAKLTVNEAIWLSLFDHQKATYIYGWYWQLRDRYPKCSPVVSVVAEVEERGKKVEKRLARGAWDGRRESVTVDRWTKENRDPTRPVRAVVR